MDQRLLKELRASARLAELDAAGTEGVPVTIQYRQTIVGDRVERRESLRSVFKAVAQSLEERGARVDLDSIAVSAQTVEAFLPVEGFDETVYDLTDRKMRVDISINRQVV